MPNPLDMVTQDQSDDAPRPRVYIYGNDDRPAGTEDVSYPNKLTQAVAPAQQQYDLPTLIEQIKAYVNGVPGTGNASSPGADRVVNRLLGTGGEERYQTWPERMIRSGTTLAGDVMSGAEPVIDPNTGRTSERVIERAMDMAGLAGGGALTERPGVATLGSGPVRPANMPKESLVPAIKWNDRVHKGKVGQEHEDIIPADLQRFLDKHELDIADVADNLPGFQTGFVDHKGRFLNHEQAAEYADTARHLVHSDHHADLKGGILTSDMLLSDTQKPGAAVSAAASSGPAPVFYSALEHATTNAAQDTMAPQQWLGYLKNQPRVKAEELAWTGLPEWLGKQKGKVKKQDVQQYLDEHKVEIKDVTKSGEEGGGEYHHRDMDVAEEQATEHMRELWDGLPAAEKRKYGQNLDEGFDKWLEEDAQMDRHSDIANRILDEDFEPMSVEGETKYSSYQLPGGENYREHLLTMPRKAATTEEIATGKARTDESGNPVSGDAYKSSHWDEPNVLAHVRTNDRVFSDGNIKGPPGWTAKKSDTALDKALAGQPGDGGGLSFNVYDDKGKYQGFSSANSPDGAVVKLIQEDSSVARRAGLLKDNSPTSIKEWQDYKGHEGALKKSLHIEEIQSDWHQQGRKQGYATSDPALKQKAEQARKDYQTILPEVHKMIEDNGNFGHRDMSDAMRKMRNQGPDVAFPDATPEQKALAWKAYDAFNNANNLAKEVKGGVPDAPFKTTWPELALKRMIRHAAENGYDRISWTPGEAQAARYDLSKTLSEIRAYKNNDGTIKLVGKKQGQETGGFHHFGDNIPADKLPDYIGKDAAEKLLRTEEQKASGGAKYHELVGTDLKVGGEGMREFYDKMLPKMAEKIGKAHGVKVKTGALPPDGGMSGELAMDILGVAKKDQEAYWQKHGMETETRDALFKKAREMQKGEPVHYFDLPQSLKDHAVGKGFPLYMSGLPFPLTPVDHDPFKKEK